MQHSLSVVDLGEMPYRAAMAEQARVHEAVVSGAIPPTVLMVEHPPTITVSHRKGAGENLLASAYQLRRLGVAVEETDRGGDITLHQPGQLVAYPILPLNKFGLTLGGYMRLLEEVVIEVAARVRVEATRVERCTGVWVMGGGPDASSLRSSASAWGGWDEAGDGVAKLCALGVRVRRGVTMHGLALNVSPDLSLFELIVPCGLANRRVTSLARELGGRGVPGMGEVKVVLGELLGEALSREVLKSHG